MSLSRWSIDQIPSQAGRVVVITGANSGLGFEAALLLAGKGAHVVMACRNVDKGHDAAARLRDQVTDASLDVRALDLASLASVRDFAGALGGDYDAIHTLCNNAGVMAIPQLTTADGFEMQLGTNHLGHHALTAMLLPSLLATNGSRVVTLTSYVHHMGRMRFDDLGSERSYNPWSAYAQSKLANMMFALELDRRLRAAGARTLSVACHPGYAATNLQSVAPAMGGSKLTGRLLAFTNRTVAQSATMGALPTVYAATAKDVAGGDLIGPDGWFEASGYPVKVKPSKRARDEKAGAELWRRSEDLTSVRFEL